MQSIFNDLLKGYLLHKPFFKKKFLKRCYYVPVLDPIINHPCVSRSNPVSLQTAKPFELCLLKIRRTLAYLSGALFNINN